MVVDSLGKAIVLAVLMKTDENWKPLLVQNGYFMISTVNLAQARVFITNTPASQKPSTGPILTSTTFPATNKRGEQLLRLVVGGGFIVAIM